jgi:mono/diheme cytochrome c family protein
VPRALLCLLGAAAVAAAPLQSWAADGAVLFTQNCLMCHQAGAVGLAGQFPRLAGRITAISSNPKGRAYLIDVLTYGMAGKITVDDQAIIGLMPPFAQIADGDVAAVLTYVQSLGDAPSTPPAPFSAEEVRARRSGPAKTATDVQDERHSLTQVHVIP